MAWYRRSLFITCLAFSAIFFPALISTGQTADDFVEQAVAAADRGEHLRAIELASRAIQSDPSNASAYKLRGRERFCAGRIAESIGDFDKYVQLKPETAPSQWERGIACYYANEFKQGAAQFERYQTYDGHDVENSVWRFLCMAPEVGVQRAREVMLPIENDRRVPMMQIFDLFRGQCSPDDVLAAARRGDPDPTILAGRLFYAHLYLGLWYDAHNQKEEATRYIQLAADDQLKTNPRINTYMWEVARIHQKKLRGDLNPRP